MLFQSIFQNGDYELGVEEFGSQILSFYMFKLEKSNFPRSSEVSNERLKKSEKHGRVIQALFEFRVKVADLHIMIKCLKPFIAGGIGFSAKMQIHIRQFHQNRISIIPKNHQLGQKVSSRVHCVPKFRLDQTIDPLHSFGTLFGCRITIRSLETVKKLLPLI